MASDSDSHTPAHSDPSACSDPPIEVEIDDDDEDDDDLVAAIRLYEARTARLAVLLQGLASLSNATPCPICESASHTIAPASKRLRNSMRREIKAILDDSQ
jgi:hypothetical protein